MSDDVQFHMDGARKHGAKLHSYVDAAELVGYHEKNVRLYDCIIFNRPHCGVYGADSTLRVIRYLIMSHSSHDSTHTDSPPSLPTAGSTESSGMYPFLDSSEEMEIPEPLVAEPILPPLPIDPLVPEDDDDLFEVDFDMDDDSDVVILPTPPRSPVPVIDLVTPPPSEHEETDPTEYMEVASDSEETVTAPPPVPPPTAPVPVLPTSPFTPPATLPAPLTSPRPFIPPLPTVPFPTIPPPPAAPLPIRPPPTFTYLHRAPPPHAVPPYATPSVPTYEAPPPPSPDGVFPSMSPPTFSFSYPPPPSHTRPHIPTLAAPFPPVDRYHPDPYWDAALRAVGHQVADIRRWCDLHQLLRAKDHFISQQLAERADLLAHISALTAQMPYPPTWIPDAPESSAAAAARARAPPPP